jgi:hypothetical protein
VVLTPGSTHDAAAGRHPSCAKAAARQEEQPGATQTDASGGPPCSCGWDVAIAPGGRVTRPRAPANRQGRSLDRDLGLSDDLPHRVVVERGDLPEIAFALPVLPGREQLDRETTEQMLDGRRNDYESSSMRLRTALFDRVLVEGESLDALLGSLRRQCAGALRRR